MESSFSPSSAEDAQRTEVLRRVLEAIRSAQTIRLPSCQEIGLHHDPFSGAIGPYLYRFEGEEDLLHLMVVRIDGSELSPADGQTVASYLLQGVPPALVLFKPGTASQHFYIGHDFLLVHLKLEAP